MITNYAYFGGVYFNLYGLEVIILAPHDRLGMGQWLICDVNI